MKTVRSLLKGGIVAMFPLVLALSACDDDELAPSEIAGEYVANSATANAALTFIEAGDTIDGLEDGASIQIELHEDGTTTGRFFYPEGGEEGEDVDENLEGEWSLDGDIITFDHDADTFLRDIEFRFAGNRLIADYTTSGTQYKVVLVRQ